MELQLERPKPSLFPLCEAAVRAIQGLAGPDEDRGALPLEIARSSGALWLLVRGGGGEWLEVRDGFCREGAIAEAASRRLDFALLRTIPSGRLVRVAGPELERRPRHAGTGTRELAIYVHPVPQKLSSLLVIALRASWSADARALELAARWFFAIDELRGRLLRLAEVERLARLGREAACALHDLRHELTVATLEWDRASAESGSAARDATLRAGGALTNAREICERSLATARPAPERHRIDLLALLRREAAAARVLSGRDERVPVEICCHEGLAVRADRSALSRLVRNLLLNAIEGSPDGERVKVDAERSGTGDISLRVLDRGRGMARSHVGELLGYGRSGGSGIGIGTASSETCARILGGTLAIESTLGSGTSAILRIPVERTI